MRELATSGVWVAAAALVLSACGPAAQATSNGTPASQAPASPAASAAAFTPERITPDQVAERKQAGEDLLFVDVRSADADAREHIAGAVHASWADISAGRANLPTDRTLVLYCT